MREREREREKERERERDREREREREEDGYSRIASFIRAPSMTENRRCGAVPPCRLG